MNGLWVNLFAPLTLVKLGWCIMALITLIECVRVWRPLYKVSVIAQAESHDVALLTWLRVPVRVASGLAMIAALNLTAGLISLSLAPPTVVAADFSSWDDLLPLAVPLTFIISAVVKMWIASTLRTSYKRVVATSNSLPEKAANLVESL